jgi:Flp pilus assembly secretin CpaC
MLAGLGIAQAESARTSIVHGGCVSREPEGIGLLRSLPSTLSMRVRPDFQIESGGSFSTGGLSRDADKSVKP